MKKTNSWNRLLSLVLCLCVVLSLIPGIPLVASAIMRVAMYEMLYMPEIPNGAAINEAVEIAKKYETPETVKFMNGILGSFVRQEISE